MKCAKRFEIPSLEKGVKKTSKSAPLGQNEVKNTKPNTESSNALNKVAYSNSYRISLCIALKLDLCWKISDELLIGKESFTQQSGAAQVSTEFVLSGEEVARFHSFSSPRIVLLFFS